MKRVRHPYLRNRMLITARLQTNYEFKKNFNKFVRTFVTEAVYIDRMKYNEAIEPTDADIAGGKNAGGKGTLPDCLNPACKEKHFVKDYPKNSEADRKKLFKVYHERKKARKK